MSARFAELDWQRTPMGDLTLRRRRDLTLDVEVYEVILGDEHLMSSHFTVAEIELAHLGLAAVTGDGLDVLVGGLGLGYTARAVLEHDRVRSLEVVEALDVVVQWHQRGLLPVSAELTGDSRTALVVDDFFARMRVDTSGPEHEGRRYDAIIVDIDHSTTHHLHPSHADFYTVDGIHRMRRHLAPGGAFALWSDDPPDEGFTAVLSSVFDSVEGHVIPFDNPLTGGTSTNSVYVAH